MNANDFPDPQADPQNRGDRPPVPVSIPPASPPLPTAAPRRIYPWGFWLPLALQTVAVLLTPIQASLLLARGESVVLQTAPVDPYDLFRGYYVTLSYNISDLNQLALLSGWSAIQSQQPNQDRPWHNPGVPFYIVLEAPAEASTPPAPWTAVRIEGDRPTGLPSNQVALQGIYRGNQVIYGLERYYIPEDQRVDINNRIQTLQRPLDPTAPPPPSSFVVQVKVGTQTGDAILEGLWLGETFLQF